MFIEQRTCGNCGGFGNVITWKVVSNDADSDISTAKRESTTCSRCGGNGWIDCAVFTVEEAKAILKHCGLTNEKEA